MKRIIILALFLFAITKVHAQTWTTTGSGTIDIDPVLSVILSNQAATPTFTTAAHYQNGRSIDNYTKITIKSNVNWIVSFKAQSTYFTPQTVGASTNMPATILGIRLDGNVTFITVTTTNQTLKLGNKGNALAVGNAFFVDMFFNPGFNYNGGLYNISMLYTMTQQ